MKRGLPLLFLIVIIGIAIYWYENRPVNEITLTGIVTTDDVIVNSQVQGRLQELKVDQGDIVKKGQLLAVIQPAEWQADVSYFQHSEQQAATQVAQAKATLALTEAQTRDQIAQAQANLAAAQAQVAQGQADLENDRLTYDREKHAYEQGAESIQVYDQARMTYEAQKAHVESLQKQEVSAQAALQLAQSNLKQIEVQQAAVQAGEHQLDAAVAQKQKAQVQLGYTELRAPVDGVVDVRAALQGEVVTPGEAIVTLINPDDLWVRADVEETYIDQIKLGEKMQVRLPSGATREGTVFYRGVDADYATQRDVSRTKRDIKTFEIRLRCDNQDRALAVGMTAYVELPLNK